MHFNTDRWLPCKASGSCGSAVVTWNTSIERWWGRCTVVTPQVIPPLEGECKQLRVCINISFNHVQKKVIEYIVYLLLCWIGY